MPDLQGNPAWVQRLQLPALRRGLELFPAVALQIGRELPSLYLDLEASVDRARLAEPALFLERHAERLVILGGAGRGVVRRRRGA